MKKVSPILLAILDGWGHGRPIGTNAIHVAATPNLDRWTERYPFTTLDAHDGAVGLPEGQMGNSEVGHLNIGAGRVVYQDFTRINRALEQGDFYTNQVLVHAFSQARESGGALHLLGLVSDGGVHSHIDHLKALVRMAADHGVEAIFVHAFMDGRDTPPKSGAGYLQELSATLTTIGAGKVATVCGRYYAMDRDNRWDRIRLAWQALVDGKGVVADDPIAAVEDAYERGETDEFIKPMVLVDDSGKPVATINDRDTVLFFNFRADRARELTHAFIDPEFAGFPRARQPALAEYLTFTRYDKHFTMPVVFPPVLLFRILGEEISRHGLRQLRIAETEKYAHVTYFFNGGREEPFPLEDRVLVPSPKDVATYDLKPEMSAVEVTDELLARLERNPYDLIVLNFANGDMVGHTGVMAAAVKACETVDRCLGRLVKKISALGGITLITSDHGNADTMYNPETNGPFTAHTSNPVPFILVSERHLGCCLRNGGALKDIAPTVLALRHLPVPDEMEGNNLLLGQDHR